MWKHRNNKIILLLISAIFIAILTRGFKLGDAPAGLYLDEAGQGYSAYSILKTGKDEFGKSFPIIFRSFTDFKTPIYVYLIVPLIPFFDLSKLAVRFPSFFFSILTIPILYLLVYELSKRKLLAAITCITLALSPWHILFGRTNFECNVALFFFVSGCLAFYKGLRNPRIMIVSAILFAIAIPSYHAQRIVTPLMLIFLILRHKKILLSKTHIKYLIVGGIMAFLISIPTLSIATTPGFLARASGLNIFTVKDSAGVIHDYNGGLSFLVNNKIFLSIQEFASLYVSYFSPREIFVLGDSGPRSSFPELGTFFVWQFPFYIYGLYLIIKKRNLSELRFFTLAFLLIAPIPAALTRDPYSTIRSLQMVIPIIILISLAITEIGQKIPKKWKYLYWLIFFVLIIYSLFKLYSSVIILNEYYRGIHWNYGWEEASQVISTLDKNLPIIVDNSRDEPYIQLAFFLKYDPVKFSEENFEVTENNYYTNMNRNKNKVLGKIQTRPINWEKDLKVHQYLIGDHLAISEEQIKIHNLKLIKEIKYKNGEISLRIFETNYFPLNK